MVKKSKMHSKRNCKDGLNSKQELLARQIRKDLLDEDRKKIRYDELKNLWVLFCIESSDVLSDINFTNYVKDKVPELYSAFKRLQLNMMDIIKN